MAEIEEVRVARFALGESWKRGMRSVMLAGDCLALLRNCRRKNRVVLILVFLFTMLLDLTFVLIFMHFSFVKRKGNIAAHYLAHIQTHEPGMQIWLDDNRCCASDMVLKDIDTDSVG